MKILFVNHEKTQCGIYEVGKRIYELFDKSIFNDIEYCEIPLSSPNEYVLQVHKHKPDVILYNYYPVTLPFVSKYLFKNYSQIKHVGIIHDQLAPDRINFYDDTFDAWIIHDETNPINSEKKFTAVRPIRRYNRVNKENNNTLTIGSHGFSVSPWKMFDQIINAVHNEFDEVQINMNITQATFGGRDDSATFNDWKKIITKTGVKLNITSHYFETENEVIDFLAKNDLNVYFYKPQDPFVGVGGSADLAVSSQSSLVVNDTYMYRHIQQHLGNYNQFNSFKPFINNKNKVKEIYDLWSPTKMTLDYKKMFDKIM